MGNKRINTALEMPQLSAEPAAPPSGSSIIYPKTDGNWYYRNASGNEVAIPGPMYRNASVTNQQINASTTAILTGSTVNIPASGLKVGTVFRYTLSVSKTAAGTAGNTFVFQLGTAGTTADADIITFTTPTATAAIDAAQIEITITIRSIGAGTAGVAQGMFWMGHNQSATGFATVPNVVLNVTSAGFNSTTANLISSLVCGTGASTVLTFHQVIVTTENL